MVSNNAINNTVQDNDFSVNRATAATAAVSSVNHSDNTNAASHATLEAISGGASGGDAFLHLQVTGSTEYSWGIDNSDSDILTLTNGASPSSGTDLLTINSTTASIFNMDLLANRRTSIGANIITETFNLDNTDTASHSYFQATSGGASGGDPFIAFNITGVGMIWTFGTDNSDSDKLKMTDGSSPSGGNTVWEMTNAGERTMPLQPAFLATHTVAQTNVTGNATEVTVNFTTEVFDQNADYDGTNLFTAPVTGRYQFNFSCYVTDIVAGTTLRLSIITSNRNYRTNYENPSANAALGGVICRTISILADMDANDTAVAKVYVDGEGADNCDLPVAAQNTYFSGSLIC